MADRLELEARFNDHASAGVKKLGKTLDSVKPSNGMQAAQKWMADFKGSADKAFKAARPVGDVLTSLGVGGLAASLSLGALARSLKNAADGALDLRELGRESGMATVEIQRLQYAVGKLHVDPSKVTGAIDAWSNKMVEFRKHTGTLYTEMLRQNGDVANKIANEDPAQGFRDMLDYLSRIPDAAMRAGKSAADAVQIQKRWAEEAGVGDLVPTLAKGPQGLKEAYADAVREVKPVSQEMIAAAERMNDSTNKFNQSWTNLVNSIGPSLINPLTGAIDKMDAVFKEGEKLFSHSGPETAPPRQPDGRSSESTGGYLMRTFRNTLRTEFSSDSGIAKDGQWLWEHTFGSTAAHADELRPGMRAMPPSASTKWRAPDEDRLSRARPDDLQKEIREGSKAGIIAGLRELAQQQDLDGKGGEGGGVGETTGGASNLRYGRPSASGGFRTTPGRHSGGSAGGDHGAAGPPGIDYNAKSALDQMGINKGEWDAFREGVTDIEGKRYNRMGGGGGRYAGRYQMGPAEITATAARLGVARPSNTQFLADPAMQERFFENYTMDHRRSLMHDPKFAALSPREQLKILGYAHNQGAGGPGGRRHGANGAWGYLENGRAGHDGFGTSGAAYPSKIQHRFDKLDAGTAADAFKARQKALDGTPPQGHRAGGWIRGAGTGTSDSIPAWLSHGEFVVRAGAAKHWGALLHAINGGTMPRFAKGGPVRGSGITPEGRGRIESWMSFLTRKVKEGGMSASRRSALGTIAMMQGESGRNLDPAVFNPNDVDGPSGGSAQWHDVMKGPWAGKLHRFSDLLNFANGQHRVWTDLATQQQFFRKEALGSMAFAWNPMNKARTAPGALKQGIDKFENPAQHALEFRRRLPNIAAMVREHVAGLTPQNAGPVDPVEVNIRHHPHTGHPIVTARAGKGVKLGIKTAPMMRPT